MHRKPTEPLTYLLPNDIAREPERPIILAPPWPPSEANTYANRGPEHLDMTMIKAASAEVGSYALARVHEEHARKKWEALFGLPRVVVGSFNGEPITKPDLTGCSPEMIEAVKAAERERYPMLIVSAEPWVDPEDVARVRAYLAEYGDRVMRLPPVAEIEFLSAGEVAVLPPVEVKSNV